MSIRYGGDRHHSLGGLRPPVRLFQHLATRRQDGHTIVTSLIVFLIQNTQNREIRIVRLKLDEAPAGR
ncbi:MAG: low affinity iron permease family protein [Rhodomicrobium sp.]